MKCIVINRTSKTIGRAWELVKEQRKPDGCGFTGNTPACPPNEPTEVVFDFKGDNDNLPCFISLQIDTLLIKNNNAKEIEITEDGMEIEIINNPSNPALELEDFGRIHCHLVKVAEGRIPEVDISGLFGRPESDTDKIFVQFRNYLHSHAFKKPRWMTFMVPPPFAPIALTIDDLKKEVMDIQSNTLVIYYRALERTPGGNYDTFVTKFVIENKKVQISSFRNWDGLAQRCPIQPLNHEEAEGHISAFVQNGLVPSMIKLLESGNNVQGGNLRHIEGTIDEEAQDSDEYNTQWSSIEVLLFKGASPEGGAAPEQSCPLLLRVHQRSVLVNWRQGWTAPKLVEPRDPASDELLAVIASTNATVLMGTTEEFSEGKSPSGKLVGSLKSEKVENKSSEVMPIYILS